VTFPADIGIIDLMLGVPSKREQWASDFGALVRDRASRDLRHGAGYMFKDLPEVDGTVDYIDFLIAEMDRWGIEKGVLPVADGDAWGRRAVEQHPHRLYGFFIVDPNKGMEGVRALVHAVTELGCVAAACFPSGTFPQVPVSDAKMYPIYAKCVELGVPIFLNAGVPGPRFPMYPQHVEHLDVVMYDFPELTVITRHGAEPWEALAVKLMLKWPNLYYSTSAFAPKHYPKAIIDYANTRGADKVMYAGYFPSGLSLERIMTELPNVPFRDEVWPKFLRTNALRVLSLD
jgi:predicted TIM-barrel fold metal-dependent hydrolase